jgi:pimeloyl-ACP methyl ester carboxylesterase
VAARTAAQTVKAAVEAIRLYTAETAIAAYRAIDVPTLLVAGAEDHGAGPITMRRIADLVPGSEFRVVPGSGHYPWAENAADFNAHFFDFLARHFPGGQA